MFKLFTFSCELFKLSFLDMDNFEIFLNSTQSGEIDYGHHGEHGHDDYDHGDVDHEHGHDTAGYLWFQEREFTIYFATDFYEVSQTFFMVNQSFQFFPIH